MWLSRFAVSMFSLGVMLAGTSMVGGQEYPNKPLRIISPGVGGSGDFSARLVAQGLTESLGQQVIVDNRSGIIAIETVAKSPPDGYTLLFYGSGLWTLPLLQKTSYDPVRDFLPITSVGSSPSVITVHPSVPVNNVKELIALAKARPRQLNYSSAQVGSVSHLAAELFKSMAGVNIVNIPYKSTGAAINAVLGGEVHVTFAAADTVAAHLKSGRLRALAVLSAEPSALAPGLPTVAASGLPGYQVASSQALWAPARTPTAIITRLNQDVARFLKTKDARDRFFNAGLDVVGGSPEQVAATMKSEMIKWGKLIKDLGIRQE